MVRRTFTLQMYDTIGVCFSPGDCGTVCHCGSPVHRHGWLDGHSAVAMFCPVCEPSLEALEADPKVVCLCGHEMSSKCATCSKCHAELMASPQMELTRTTPRAPDAWGQCEAKGCFTFIQPEARLCVEHWPEVAI